MSEKLSDARVLLVEDSNVDAALILRLLQQTTESFSVEVVGTLAAAISLLSEREFDVVVLDLILPDSEGISTFTKFQAHFSDIPVILLTGMDEDKIGVAAVQSGAQDFINKRNINAELLCRSIRYAIERNALLRREQQLQQQVYLAGQRERQRISHDLHDSLGQLLAGLSMMTSALMDALPESSESQRETVAAIQNGIREVISELRNVIHGLTPVQHDPSGLQVALQRLCVETQNTTGIRCELQSDEQINLPDVNTATHLYRITQESIGNAVKYSGASEIEVLLSQSHETPPTIELAVRDNGCGFSIDDVSLGNGLNLMKYRAQLIGARFAIESDSAGTEVRCQIGNNRSHTLASNGVETQ